MSKTASAGKWSIEHWEGGHPVWGFLSYNGEEILRHIRHEDLHDLAYVVDRAIKNARDILPDSHKHEMD